MAAIKGIYYNSGAGINASNIKTELFTHIYYAFLSPNGTTFELDISQAEDNNLRSFTAALGTRTPPVKMLFSVGGADDKKALIFSQLASNKTNRMRFMFSCVAAARKYGFHGFDIDWEFPRTELEMTNFGLLLDDLRAGATDGLKPNQQPLLITAAVNSKSTTTWPTNNLAYPYGSMSRNLDWINVMTYDYYGSWDVTSTGAPAALYNQGNPERSTSFGLNSWVQAGIPTSKLIMGLPLYGKTWKLVDPNRHGIGAPASGVGPGVDGVLVYRDVVQFNGNNNATLVSNS